AEKLHSFGYSVEIHGPFANVVALPGNAPKALTLVGAHYDSISRTPGADDNASAVAAMLGCAKAVARLAAQPAIGFVAFNCEEEGFAGSADFVENYRSGFEIAHIHVLEMVGMASSAAGSQRVPTGLPIALPNTGHFLGLLANDASSRQMREVLQCARDY